MRKKLNKKGRNWKFLRMLSRQFNYIQKSKEFTV